MLRIRDPLHNLIEFRTDQQLERMLWKAIDSRAFQRLRRIKQLGFSELVYPGATHSRFAHSVGVFHTARELMEIVRQRAGEERWEAREHCALAAALVHDVGHGPFSHAFETVGKRLGLTLADHEQMSDRLIRDGELAEILKDMGSGFADDVADMIKKEGRQTVHNAVVSSQFDADRLDYMRRDRLMTGSQHSAIDFTWLLANLEIADVPIGVDESQTGTLKTFVIGPKAIHAAEAYILGLFQLYPTVYFHKATRSAEKIFAELLVRVVGLVRDGLTEKVGLPKNHPLIKFANAPEDIETALLLDDTVVWGSLSIMSEADDEIISILSKRLRDRKLLKCFDIRVEVMHKLDPNSEQTPEQVIKIDKCCAKICASIQEWDKTTTSDSPRLLVDEAERSAYKTGEESSGPTEQINVRTAGGDLVDLKQRSDVVASLKNFKLTRVYYADDDDKALKTVKDIVKKEAKEYG